LRTLSLALSVAAALMGAALAFSVSHPDSPGVTRSREIDLRLIEGGFQVGSPVLIRIFKQESELELWMQSGDRFRLFATYPICFWSGGLGPKEREGDRQAPEGYYTVGAGQLHRIGRHPRSLNIGFPNAVDRSLGRTGSYILVHGGCTSIGCFAMTDAVMDEIYGVAEQALGNGQDEIQVQIFPFRMQDEAMAAHADSKWSDFWQNLKRGYDAFERTHVPPDVIACGGKYAVANRQMPSDDDAPPATERCEPGQSVAWRVAPSPRLMGRRMARSRPIARGSRHRPVASRVGSRQVRLAHGARRLRTSGVPSSLRVR
jgi:murein L,D-transpeptidase YafK